MITMSAPWPMRKLGEVCEIFNGNSIPAKVKQERYTSGQVGIPYIGTKDVAFDTEVTYDSGVVIPEDDSSKFRLAPANSTLICAEGGSAGRKIGFTSRAVHFGNKLYAIVPSDVLESKFVFYFLRSDQFRIQFQSRMSGMIGGVSQSKFKTIQIPIPSLHEQQQIVSILDEAFANLANWKNYHDSISESCVHMIQSAIQLFISPEDLSIPLQSLSQLATKITKGSSPKWQGVSYIDKPGVLFVTSENVGSNRMLFKKKKYVESRFNEIEPRSRLEMGDVLTNIVGASIGRTAVYDQDVEANINQAVCLIRCDETKLLNKYLAFLLNSNFFVQILHANEVNTARANLSLGFFKTLEIPTPPLATQHSIVERLDTVYSMVSDLAAVNNQHLACMNELEDSILQAAFNGRLTGGRVA